VQLRGMALFVHMELQKPFKKMRLARAEGDLFSTWLKSIADHFADDGGGLGKAETERSPSMARGCPRPRSIRRCPSGYPEREFLISGRIP
jgi:hypothetical protein